MQHGAVDRCRFIDCPQIMICSIDNISLNVDRLITLPHGEFLTPSMQVYDLFPAAKENKSQTLTRIRQINPDIFEIAVLFNALRRLHEFRRISVRRFFCFYNARNIFSGLYRRIAVSAVIRERPFPKTHEILLHIAVKIPLTEKNVFIGKRDDLPVRKKHIQDISARFDLKWQSFAARFLCAPGHLRRHDAKHAQIFRIPFLLFPTFFCQPVTGFCLPILPQTLFVVSAVLS